MGVYIPNMEMPKSCWECRFNSSTIDHREACLLTNKTYNWGLTTPPSDCPLVPVPPHGRLIDADEFLKRAIGTKCFRGDYALMLEELVGESTTIIPAEGGRVMNDTTFQGNGKVVYVPVVVNAKPPKQTNADRIRAMTDEELAEFLNTVNTEFCSSVMGKSPCRAENCPCWLGWLKQEADNGK